MLLRSMTVCILSCPACAAATVHVAPGGIDGIGYGSATQPYRTMAYAVARAQAGDTVQLAAGEYPETQQTVLGNGIRIVGAGSVGPGRSLVRAPLAWDFRPQLWSEDLGGYIIRLSGAQGCSIEGLAFDGNGSRANGAIHAAEAADLVVRDVAIREFRYFGLRILDSRRVTVRQAILHNAGFEHRRDSSTPFPDGGSLGAIGLHGVADSLFEDIVVGSDAPHGYGMKAGGLDRCEFVRMNFAMHPFQSWMNDTTGGGAGNFDIEVHGGHIRQSVFRHCRFTATLSLMGGSGILYDDVDYSVHLHHNVFDLNGGLGIELGTDRMVIDHNEFIDGWSMLQNYGGADVRIRDLTFCHNVARDVGMRLIGGKGDLDNLRMFNNTVVMSQDGYQGYLVTIGSQRGSTNWAIANNLVIGDATAPDSGRYLVEAYQTNESPTDLVVRHNLLRHVTPAVHTGAGIADTTVNRHAYAANTSADPLLPFTGIMPQQAFMPPVGSPAIDAGDAAYGMRTAVVGTGRDVGAFERDEAPWAAGIASSDTATYLWAPRTLITDDGFTGSLNVDLYTAQTGVQIRYTLDGSEPHAGSAVYSAPITLTAAARLRARCFRDGWGSPTCLVRDFSTGSDGWPNLARDRTYTCSSSYDWGQYGPDRAFDGDTYNWIGWTPGGGDSLSWVQVDLGSAHRIRHVELYARAFVDSGAGGRRNFAIQGANNPTGPWTSLASQGSTAIPHEGVFRADVTVTTPFRHVRAVKTVADEGFFVTELVVRGEAGNSPPASVLLAPALPTRVNAGAAMTLSAHAADRDGVIARVEFLVDGNVVGMDGSAPYDATWTPGPGTYSVAVRAVDEGGATATSAAVSVTATPSVGNLAPVIGSTLAQPASVVLP